MEMPESSSTLISNAEVNGVAGCDLLVSGGRIEKIGAGLGASADTVVVDAAGGALLPGLNDHHLHLAALAAARASLACGPPQIDDAEQLGQCLRRAAEDKPAGQWLRGIGYHESVAGDIDAAWLDACVDNCPVRIQHRGGRMWVFNSRALACLQPAQNDPLERVRGRLTGRLIDGDVWLRTRLRRLGLSGFPDLRQVSRELASYGITGVTDTTPHNGSDALSHFAAARADGSLLQTVRVMGHAGLDSVCPPRVDGLSRGEHKFHLLESALPDFTQTCAAIQASHQAGRGAAFHCVTRTELVFALTALREAGERPGDRIEHASVTPPELLEQIADRGLTVVTQPVFVRQRGDQYLAQVAIEDQPWLYRLRTFQEAGVALAASSDAPFGDPNPWLSMAAAVTRETLGGQSLGAAEGLTPEQALALFTGPLGTPGQRRGALQPGEPADLCLLTRPWRLVRDDPAAAQVRMTFSGGRRIWASPTG